jgi:hypothetical protein
MKDEGSHAQGHLTRTTTGGGEGKEEDRAPSEVHQLAAPRIGWKLLFSGWPR